jgi:hypothetical protein
VWVSSCSENLRKDAFPKKLLGDVRVHTVRDCLVVTCVCEREKEGVTRIQRVILSVNQFNIVYVDTLVSSSIPQNRRSRR